MNDGSTGYGNYLVLRSTTVGKHMSEILEGVMDAENENDLRVDWMGDEELLGDFGKDWNYLAVDEDMHYAGAVRIAIIATKPLDEWAKTVAHDYPEVDIEFSWRYLGGKRVVKGDEDGWERVLDTWAPLADDAWEFREQNMGVGNRPLKAARSH